jgi:hypothetical protein
MQAPAFVGGMFKSGTSLLRAMLGQHKNIASGLETYWFEMDIPAGKGRGGEPLKDQLARLTAYYGLDLDVVRGMTKDGPSAEVFLDRFMTEAARVQKKPRWLEKTPGNITQADRIQRKWPGAPIMHIVRDPRDIYASFRLAKKWDQPDAFASRWSAIFAAEAAGLRSHALNGKTFLAVRYENLVNQPEPTIRTILSFLAEPWDPAAARFAGRDDEYNLVLKETGKASTTLARMREPLVESRVGLWREVPAAELKAVRDYAARQGLGERYDAIVAESDQIAATH